MIADYDCYVVDSYYSMIGMGHADAVIVMVVDASASVIVSMVVVYVHDDGDDAVGAMESVHPVTESPSSALPSCCYTCAHLIQSLGDTNLESHQR